MSPSIITISIQAPSLSLPLSLSSQIADTTGSYESSILSPHGSLQSSPLDTSPLATIPPSSCNGGGRIEEEGDVVFPANVSHSWLCNDTLLCLHDSSQPENMAAFQHHWRRGSVRPLAVHFEIYSHLSFPPSPSCSPSSASDSSRS